MARNIDISLLRAFATVAERGSVTRAAALLNLSQGAVSQQIARLEALCGDLLLIRERRGVRLTPFGERLLGKAREMLTLNDEIWSEIQGDAMAGMVRLGAPHDLAGATLATVLKAYARSCPRVEVSLLCGTSTELARLATKGDLDLALVEEPLGASSAECLAVERLVWAGARFGFAHLKTPLPVSLVSETCAFRPAVIAGLRKQDRDWQPVFESGSQDTTIAMTRADLAVSVWLETTVPADLDILPVESGLPALPSFGISLYQPAAPQSPAVAELARQIRTGFTRRA